MAIESMYKKQNTPDFIRRLKAQRSIYSRAKNLMRLKSAGDLIFLVGGGAAAGFYPGISPIMAVSSILWLIPAYIISKSVSRLVKKAALIQESFDVGLFQIRWNDLLGSEVGDGDILEAAEGVDETKAKLRNWYFATKEGTHWSAVLNCQKTNTSWDLRLREKYKNFVTSVFFVVLCLMIYALFLANPKINIVLVNLIAPSLPFLLTIHEAFTENSRIIEEKENLRLFIRRLKKGNSVSCRQIQDIIFGLRTKTAFIPDWFYWIFRDKFEKQEKIIARKA